MRHGLEFTQTEVRTWITWRFESRARRDNVVLAVSVLGRHFQLSADCHAVALRSHQSKDHPIIVIRCHIAEDSGFSVQDSHDDVHLSVVEQVADYSTAIWLGELHCGASLRRHSRELPFSPLAENRVRFSVSGTGKFRNIVEDVASS